MPTHPLVALGLSALLVACRRDEDGPGRRNGADRDTDTPVTDDSDGDGIPDAADRCDGDVFGGEIVLGSGRSTGLEARAAGDLALYLGRATGAAYTVGRASSEGCRAEASGVFLATPDELAALGAPPDVIDGASLLTDPLGYRLDLTDAGAAWITAIDEAGLQNGLYGLLDVEGVRFWLPGDVWATTRPVADASIARHALSTPGLRSFTYEGTGGWGSSVADLHDPYLGIDGINAAEKPIWDARNRHPVAFVLGGHAGESFSIVHSDALVADPRLVACVRCADGDAACAARPTDPLCHDRGGVAYRRDVGPDLPPPSVTQITKVDSTNHGDTLCGTFDAPRACARGEAPTVPDLEDWSTHGGAIGLWTDFAIENALLAWESRQQGVEPFVSVDPADGAGHCECDKCRDLLRLGAEGVRVDADSSISDRVFHMADFAARAVDAEIPGMYVNLYAYDQRAAVPTVPLEPNMMITVVPYAFHSASTGLSDDALIDAWFTKRDTNPRGPFRLAVYDYWNIPDWSWDAPRLAPTAAVDRISDWSARGFEAASLESSHGFGGTGLPLLLAARRVWQDDVDVDAELDAFAADAFGPASGPMRRLFDLFWAQPWRDSPLPVADALVAVADAMAASADAPPEVQERVRRFAAYILYLQDMTDALQSPPNRREARVIEAIDTTLRISDVNLVANTRVWEVLYNTYAVPPEWVYPVGIDPAGDAALAALEAEPWTFEEVAAKVAAASRANPPVVLVPERASEAPLVPFTELAPTGALAESAANTYGGTWLVWADAGDRVTVEIGSTVGYADQPGGRATVTAPDGRVVAQAVVPTSYGEVGYTELAFRGSTAGAYRVEVTVFEPYTYTWLRYPADRAVVRQLPTFFDGWDPHSSQSFYVPLGTERFAYETSCELETRFLDPDGNEVGADTRGFARIVEVPAGADGRPWTLAGACWDLRFVNLPNLLADTPDNLMIPEGG